MKTFCFCLTILLVLWETYGSGEIRDIDTNSGELLPIVQYSELMLNRAVNSLYLHKVGNVLKAQKQIVSGVKYYLSFEFNETTCLKNKAINEDECKVTKTEVCTVQVWSRPWITEHKMELVTFSCKPQ